MATFTVTTAADVVDAGDGELSLREAVAQANATVAEDSIGFAAGLEGQTLTLTQGQLTLADSEAAGRTTIDGDADNNGTRVTLDGGGQGRVLEVADGGDANLSGLVVANGDVDTGSGGGILIGAGCGVRIDSTQVRDCAAGEVNNFEYLPNQGGGIAVGANSFLSLNRCSISDNFANDGGGISVAAQAQLTATNTIIRDNSTGFYTGAYSGFTNGGGIVNDGLVELTNATLARNEAGFGGGISGGTVRLTNTTLVGNVASGGISEATGEYGGTGGGIDGSDVTLNACTITGNTAVAGGGIANSSIRVSDSIVAGNESQYGFDIGGATAGSYGTYRFPDPLAFSNGHNIFGTFARGSAPGDLLDVAAQRLFAAIDPGTGGGSLGANGGFAPTVALRDGLDNPALGGAAPAAADATDGRGAARPAPGTTNPDVGAFELAQTAISTSATPGNDVLAGTAAADTISGLAGVDIIGGLGGNDRLFGNDGGDTLRGGNGDDLLEGGSGSDTLDGGVGIDQISYFNDALPLGIRIELAVATGEEPAFGLVFRGSETDRLIGIENADGSNFGDTIIGDDAANRLGGAGGDDLIRGGLGADVLAGGLGNDRLFGGSDLDLADYALGNAVTVDLSLANDRAVRGAEVDTLADIEGAIGSGSADTLRGDAAANLFRGQCGKDTLTGGGAADLFDFDATSQSTVGANRDVVTDFATGSDDLDLATIDARTATAATNEAFTFLASRGAAFTAAGQVRWYQSGGNTLVEANVDANLGADMQIQLTGLKPLTAADFIL